MTLDEQLLQRARELALREHTTVNALIRDDLTRYVDVRSLRLQALDALYAVGEWTESAIEGS